MLRRFICHICPLSVKSVSCSRVLNMSTENKIQTSKDILSPPLCVSGVKTLDRDSFKKDIDVPTVSVPVDKLKATLKVLKPCMLKMCNLQPVQGEGNVKNILLNPMVFDEKLLYIEQMLRKLSISDVEWTKITLSYDNFNHESIFKAVLPSDTAGNVSGFSIIGHIIHLNLKPELLDYRFLIGQVFLDKFANIRTVVNKVQVIETEFRNFQMELLAGEPDYCVTVKENGFQYMFDFSKVFWNPRLVHEHAEIVKKIENRSVVFDVFAGVGPFAIPLGKKKCTVYANDLNPDSYEWLCHNVKLNKVSEYVSSFNLDGVEFIKTVVKEKIIEHWRDSEDCSIYIIMNLPACALNFLKAFDGLLCGNDFSEVKMPTIFCHFFLKKEEDASLVINEFIKVDDSKFEVSTVRVVAPNKLMMRLTYEIPPSVLLGVNIADKEPASKKIKLS